MKALVLAAGYGKRLRPITDTIPKSMVPVNGTPLLMNTMNNLVACGITEIGIVVGHKAEYIQKRIGSTYCGAAITYYENPRYLETNNVVSLLSAEAFMNDDVLLLECDILYRKDMLDLLLAGEGDCTILVSPFHPDTMDGSVIRTADGNKAMELILGKWQGADFDYTNMKKTVNLYKFKKDFIQNKYMPLVRWYVEHMSENSYYEKVLGALLYLRECDARVVEVPADMWCEIDNEEDLKRASVMFR